jgi:hypothetical protein
MKNKFLGKKFLSSFYLYRLYPYFGDELLTLREYRGGWKTTRKTPRNTIVELQPCLLIRPVEADTFPVLLTRAHNTLQPLFNRDTGRLPRLPRTLSQNNPVCTK